MENNRYSKTEYVDTETFEDNNRYSTTEGLNEGIGMVGNSNVVLQRSINSSAANNSMFRLGQFYVPAKARPMKSGGQGRIYLCNSTESSKNYIAKIYDCNDKLIEKIRLINEKLKRINHPNIANVLDAGDTEDGAYFMVVMEQYKELQKDFMFFERYKNKIDDFTSIFLNVLRDMNQALMEIHRVNIYHSDIKPANIMRYKGINYDERYVIIDFGGGAIAAEKLGASDVKKDESATASMFTRGYQAPEMFQGHMNKYKANSKTDAFALGMTMVELMAGVSPYVEELRYDTASPREKDYLKKNQEKGKIVYGILLPEGLPDYFVRLFEGLLYRGDYYSESKEYRWGDKEVARWITYVEAGEYEKAAQMKHGNGKSQEAAPQPIVNDPDKRNKMYISYNNVDIQVSSEAEMVEAFVKNWRETINNVMNNPQWVKSFERLGPDVAQLLVNVGNQMKQNPAKAENIFEKRIVDRFSSEEFKQNLFHGGKLYKNKAELGKMLFAVVSEKLKDGDNVKLMTYNQIKKENKNDMFFQMLYLFQENYLSEAIASKGEKWSVSPEDMDCIKRWEDRMNSANPNDAKGKIDDFINLLRLSYHLQEKAAFEFDGKIYTEYAKFMEYLSNVSKTDLVRAAELGKRCMENGRMKIPFYAWCMEVADLQTRPDITQKPI